MDNLQWVYPELSTLLVRSLFQSFAILCLIVTLVILLVHIYGLRYSGKHFVYFNQLVSQSALSHLDDEVILSLVLDSQRDHGPDDDIHWCLRGTLGR